MTLTLPQELIVEILLRLPVRSLLRFKCVCKSWLSLISDPQFANSHFDLAASPSHRLLLRRTIDDEGFIQSIDLEASLSHNDSSVAALKLRFPPTSPLSPHSEYDVAEILGSCRGLVLLYYYSSTDLILWNPSTGLYNRLPHFGCSFFAKGFHYGFAYDASTDDYVLVFMDSNDAFMDFNDHESGDGGVGWDRQSGVILGHFRTNSWRYTGDIIKFPYVALQRQFRAGSFLNGAFHWMVMSCEKFVPTILAFDFKEKTSSEIPLPRHLLVETVHKFYSLIVIGGCLGVCCEVQGQSRDEIWVMKEYKVESSWTKHIVMSTYGIPHNHFTPVYVTKDGGILGSNLRRRLEKLNDKGQLLEHLKYVGDDAMYKVNLDMYIESLLSPLSLNWEGNKQL